MRFFSLGFTFNILHDLLKGLTPDTCDSLDCFAKLILVTVIREITQNPVFQLYESILSEKTDCLWTESGQNIERFIILI